MQISKHLGSTFFRYSNLLGETVFLVVTKIVPSTLDAVVEKVRPVVGQIYVLNIAGIAETLGLKPPMT